MPNEFILDTSPSDTQGMILCKMLVLALTVLIATGHAQPDNTALLRAVASANARKAEVEQYVKAIKRSVKPPDRTYAEARRRYFLAYSLNNEFMAEAVTSLADGRSTRGLAAKASEIQLRTTEFTEYACNTAFGKRRSIGELTHSATTLIDVASYQKHAVQINRQIVNALVIELQWRSWTDIN
jgi:hypothetical protein